MYKRSNFADAIDVLHGPTNVLLQFAISRKEVIGGHGQAAGSGVGRDGLTYDLRMIDRSRRFASHRIGIGPEIVSGDS